MSQIKLIDVSKGFHKKKLFHNISLSVEEGESVGIVGANGSGKSVLFKIISGLEKVDSGSVFVRGHQVGEDFGFAENVGVFVNQPGYIEFYDGFTNLKLLSEIQNKIDHETIRYYMEKIGLNPKDRTRVKNYSSGMKQKLGIVQAIMEDQDIVLLDEPFNALDFQTNHDVMNILKQLKEQGKTFLLTSHQQEFLEKICDRLYIIMDYSLVPLDEKIKEKYFMLR